MSSRFICISIKMVSLVSTVLLVFPSAITLVQSDKCITPNNETAECIPLYSCPIILNALTDPTAREFVQKSNCGGTAVEPLVCCGTKSNFTQKPDQRHLSSSKICGLQHSDDYFSSSNDTLVTEFPWMALIEFRLRNDSSAIPPDGRYQCSGSLINQHYVLTAAQCLSHPEYMPVAVRLGEYHIKNKTDCVEEEGLYECAESSDFAIEKLIQHPEANIPESIHDVGLIRLKERVRYSDYIRPICLSASAAKTINVGDTLITSGWGKKTGYDDPEYVEVKKTTINTLITNEECSSAFQHTEIKINDDLMCAVRKSGSGYVCYADAGGPVMFRRKRKWYQVAIVSYGIGCEGLLPEAFTRVDLYLDWIKENIEL